MLLELAPPVRGEHFLSVLQQELDSLTLELSRLVDVRQDENINDLQ